MVKLGPAGIVLAITALTVTACGVDDQGTGARRPTPQPSPTSPRSDGRSPDSNAPATCDPMVIRAKDAIPAAKSTSITQRMLVDPAESGDVGVLAVAETGEVLQEIGRHDVTTDGAIELNPGELEVLDPATGKRQEIRGTEDLHPGTQTIFADLDADHVVWTEQPDVNLQSSNWVMYVANRATGEITEVARAREIEELATAPAVPGYTIPTLQDGWVYWAEARPNPVEGKAPVVNTYGRPIDRRARPTLLAENAAAPVVSGNWLYYVEFVPEQFDKPEYAVYRKDLETGETTLVHEATGTATQTSTGKAAYLTADGETVAWSLGDTVQVFAGTEQIAEVAAPTQLLVWLHAGDRMIGFNDTSDGPLNNYLLDLRGGCRLFNLGAAKTVASEVKVAGRTVVWATGHDHQRPSPRRTWHYATLD